MSKKVSIFILLIVILIGVFISQDTLISSSFEWIVNQYCKTYFGGKLSYENIRHEKGFWVIEYPVIQTTARLEDGGYHFQAESAKIDLSIDWRKSSVNLEVFVESPHIDIGKGGEEIKRKYNLIEPSFVFFDIQTLINVPKGTIFIHDFKNDYLVPVPIFFSLDVTCKEQKEVCISIRAGSDLKENPDLFVVFSEPDKKTFQLAVDVNEVNGSLFQQSIQGLFPEFKHIQVFQGEISGNLILTFPKEGTPYAEGKLRANNILIKDLKVSSELGIESLSLSLTPKKNYINDRLEVETIGYLDMPLFADFIIFKNGLPFWTVDNLSGSLNFQTKDFIKFSLTGDISTKEKKRALKLEGEGQFLSHEQSDFSINAELKEKDIPEDLLFHFSARNLLGQSSLGTLNVKGFGVEELSLLKYLVGINHPEWEKLNIIQGNIEATALFYFKERSLSEVKVEKITAKKLEIEYPNLKLSAGLKDLFGSFSFNFNNVEPFKIIDADLNIDQGFLNLEGLNQCVWKFTAIDTNLSLRKGVIQKSILKGKFAGLNGEILLDGTSPSSFATFNFNGLFKEFAKALPESFLSDIEKKFSQDHVTLSGQCLNHQLGLLFDGTLIVDNFTDNHTDIPFGFILSMEKESSFKKQKSIEEKKKISSMDSIYKYLEDTDTSFSRIVIKNGWFRGRHLALEKYVSPFLLKKNNMKLKGLCDFQGNFDSQSLIINYDASSIVLENENFCVDIPKIYHADMRTTPFVGQYICNFNTDEEVATFSIRNGTYFEKNSGLLFTEVNTEMRLKNETVFFSDLKGFCNGLYLSGSSFLDWSMPGDGFFNVGIQLDQVDGKISHLQYFLSHVKEDTFFLKIPIEGDISLRKPGGYINFAFKGDDYDVESHISGSFSDGNYKRKMVDMSIQELCANFEYNHKPNTLDFSEIEGVLLVGKQSHIEEYSLHANQLKFIDFSQNESEFDLWIEDKKGDFIRLAGKTRSFLDETDSSIIKFHFNKVMTHFGSLYPKNLDLVLKNWSEIELFHMEFDFELENLLTDFQKYSHSGLLPCSRSLIKEIKSLSHAKGIFNATLDYESTSSVMHYLVKGNNLDIGQQKFNQFVFSGIKKDDLWSVDQFQLDHISLAFDLIKESSFWNINFLGARIGTSLLLGMEGQYRSEESHLEAKINLLEANLEDFNQWPTLQKALGDQALSGAVRASGSLYLDFNQYFSKGISLDIKMNGSIHKGVVSKIFLNDIENMSFHYNSLTGLSFYNVNTAIKSENQDVSTRLVVEKYNHNFKRDEQTIKGLHFDIPLSELENFIKQLEINFPKIISPDLNQTICSLQKEGSLQGSLDLMSAGDQFSLDLKLQDNKYGLMGSSYDMKDLSLHYSPLALKLSSSYLYKNKVFKFDIHSSDPKFQSGDIIVSEIIEGKSRDGVMPLIVDWKIDKDIGFYIENITGSLSGMYFNLTRNLNKPLSNESINLNGRLNFNLEKTAELMDDNIAEALINFECGEGYALNGDWCFFKNISKNFLDTIGFKGVFSGREFELAGYRFNDLSAHVDYTGDRILLEDITLSDSCGALLIEKTHIVRVEDEWILNTPLLTLTEFHPHLLRSITLTREKFAAALNINHLYIKDIQGVLGDRSSFKGEGSLSFLNLPKTNLQHTIFAIPAELITRIGLDLSVLTPIRGTISYEIGEGRANITGFKDIYSKGRVSKFYLPKTDYESYVDFDGNLHLQIRMKQHNLLFKLAELFTVTIQGTLKKPTYSLKKQHDRHELRSLKEVVQRK